MSNNIKEKEIIFTQDENPDISRKRFLIKLFGIIGVLLTLPFGLLSLYSQNYFLGIILLSISLALTVNYFFLSNRYKMSADIIVYSFLFLFSYLVYSGGVENSGSLWIYAFPALTFFLHGLKKGTINIALFMSILIGILFIGGDALLAASYSLSYKIRLLFSLFVVSFLSGFYEYSSMKAFDEMRSLTKKLINTAKQDYVTELATRRGIHEEMELLYNYAKENNEPLCVMLCDIDYLHDINERYGHHVGDLVIKEIAKEIQNSIKNTDTLARWSGDEFLILLPQTKVEDAHLFAAALMQRIKNLSIKYDIHKIPVTLSIGISDIETAKSMYSAVRHADNNMYQAINDKVAS